MDYNERWEQIEKLGEGGQGKVYLALLKTTYERHLETLSMLARIMHKSLKKGLI